MFIYYLYIIIWGKFWGKSVKYGASYGASKNIKMAMI